MLRMTPEFDCLLRGSDELPLGILQLHWVTAEQLRALHYRKSLTHVKELLKKLCDEGYAQYDAYPVKHVTPTRRFFSSPYYYMLGPNGVSYLRKLGMEVKSAEAPKPYQDTYPDVLRHHLELNDLVISAALLKHGFYLHNLWTQQEFNERPYIARWASEPYKLVPDAFLEFGQVGVNAYLPVLLEYDRYTEFGRAFSQRIRAYGAYLRERGYVTQLGVQNVFVAFCTHKGEHRRQIMQEIVTKELHDSGLDSLFLFANLPQPPDDGTWLASHWYTIEGGPHALLALQ